MNTTTWIYLGAEGMSGLLSFLLNSLVLVAIYRSLSLQSPSHVFLGGQALADLLVGVVVPPSVLVVRLGIPRDFHACLSVNSLDLLVTNLSVLNLLVLALATYNAVQNTDCHQELTVAKALMVVVVAWGLGVLLTTLPDLGWNRGYGSFDDTCTLEAVIPNAYLLYVRFLVVVAPTLLVMLAAYTHAVRVNLLLHANRWKRKQREQRRARMKVRSTVSLVAAVLLFAACWLPVCVLATIREFFPSLADSVPHVVRLAARVLTHANSVFNPVVYTSTDPGFRKAYRRVLACRKKPRATSPLHASSPRESR